MTPKVDLKDDSPSSPAQSMSLSHHRSACVASSSRQNLARFSSFSIASRPRVKPCHDWIFSSATNVHVALDKSAFKEYVAFDSYVQALSDNRPIFVEGIGSVELKIKRRPESRESHTILLNDVLHIPSWLCNIFSDVYFGSSLMYDHTWTDTGVQFRKRQDGESKPWGYTESFCSLDRMVLARRAKDSRSPMLEEKDREIFSISVIWPHSQRHRWHTYLAENQHGQLFRTCSEPGFAVIERVIKESPKSQAQKATATVAASRRAIISDMAASAAQAPGERVSSLRANTGGHETSGSNTRG